MGAAAYLEIDSVRFEALKTARRGVVFAMVLEEKFNVVLDNFLEFENDLLQTAQAWMVFHEFAYSSMHDKRVDLNRRLANYLSATRAYIDQLPRGVSQMYGTDSDHARAVKAALSHEFDTVFEYRVVEALRNYAQHNTFPITEISFNSRTREIDGVRRNVVTIVPNVNLEELARDSSVNRKVALELQSQARLVTATSLVRPHISALGRVHGKFQALVAGDVAVWESAIVDAISQSGTTFGSDVGLAASKMRLAEDAEWEEVESVSVFRDLVDRRRALNNRTQHASTIANHVVGGLQ